MRFEQFLIRNAAAYGTKTALVTDRTRLSYDELDDLSSRLAAALAASGVNANDRVLVFMDNCWEAAVAIFAILKAGATFSPVNASTKADKLAYIITDCEAAAILTQAKLMPIVAEARALSSAKPLFVASTATPGGRTPEGAASFEACLEAEPVLVLHGGIDVDLAMLIYTSGSTGRPKGVMMTHRNIDAASHSITTYLRNTPDDVILNVLPLAFDYGLYQLLMAIRLGATLVLEKSFAFPQAIFERIRAEGVTGFPLVPTMAAMILQMRDLEPGFLASLRYISNTAAALPPAHIARLRELFPSARLYSMYGLTECKRCTYLPPEELDRRPGSVGIAIPNTEAFVVDDDGKRVPPGVPGELVIRGPHVMQGYWRNEAATERMLRPGPNPGKRCSTRAISSAPTLRGSSISSAARTTSSRRAARRWRRRRSRPSCMRIRVSQRPSSSAFPTRCSGLPSAPSLSSPIRPLQRRTSFATAPVTSRTSWCRRSSNSAPSSRRRTRAR